MYDISFHGASPAQAVKEGQQCEPSVLEKLDDRLTLVRVRVRVPTLVPWFSPTTKTARGQSVVAAFDAEFVATALVV